MSDIASDIFFHFSSPPWTTRDVTSTVDTISLFIPEVVDAIVSEYGELVVMPESPDGWRAVARGFSSRGNYNHCVGAVELSAALEPGHGHARCGTQCHPWVTEDRCYPTIVPEATWTKCFYRCEEAQIVLV